MRDGLWSVTPEVKIDEGVSLYIIATTFNTAIRKAERWLKKRGYSSRIKGAEFKGTIDAY